jgi:hypothetical protein
MRTIRENLEQAIGLLKTNKVVNHLRACELVYLDLTTIPNFPPDVTNVLIYYQKFLVEKHQSVKKVGLFEKIWQWFNSRMTRRKLIDFINKASRLELGDGSKYLQEIFLAIRKAI